MKHYGLILVAIGMEVGNRQELLIKFEFEVESMHEDVFKVGEIVTFRQLEVLEGFLLNHESVVGELGRNRLQLHNLAFPDRHHSVFVYVD